MLQVITPPVAVPLTLDDAKIHLGVTASDRDTYIVNLIGAASNFSQRWTGRTWINTTYRMKLADFEPVMGLPYPPLSSVTSVQYYDVNGALQTFTGYQIDQGDNSPACLLPPANGSWPAVQSGRNDAVIVDYVVGYGTTPDNVPAEAKHLIRLLLRHWYDNASAILTGSVSKEIELTARALAWSLKVGNYAHV